MENPVYDNITKQVFDFLYGDPNGVLRRFRVHDHLGDDQLRAEIIDLVEDIKRQIPDGFSAPELQLLFPELSRALRRLHAAQYWPSAKTFIAATQEAVRVVNELRAKERVLRNEGKPKADELSILETKMMKRQRVPEPVLWGPQAAELMKRGRIDKATFESYRKDAYEARVRQYGLEQANKWLAEREAWHAKAAQR